MQGKTDYAERWKKLAENQREALEKVKRSNRERFRPIWDLAREDFRKWFHEGPGLEDLPRAPGGFAIETDGDLILTGIQPGGVLTNWLSDKQGGLLVSPRFTIDSESISIHAFGGGGAMARVIVDNYPLPDNPVFPKAVLQTDAPGWIRLDTAYRKGNWPTLSWAPARI